MITDERRLRRILERVIEYTRNEQLDWQPGATAAFVTHVSGTPVQIRSTGSDGAGPFDFSIFNADETEIQRISSRPVEDLPESSRTRFRELNTALQTLFRLAEDYSYGISETLANVERALDLR